MTFADKHTRACDRSQSLLCVGHDPDPALLPDVDPAPVLRYVIEATIDLVCCYKPNLAFFEALGRNGYDLLARALEAVPADIPVLADSMRDDIGSTAVAYARALFDVWGFDAITVNPFGGEDAVRPFIAYADRGVFVWCRSSNPGARDFQDLRVVQDGGARPFYEVIAEQARDWNTHGNVGLVAAATYPSEIARLRELCPSMPFLVPGVGAQGGESAAAVRAACDARGAGFIVNSSRGVLYASRGEDYAQAARTAAQRTRDEINRYRSEAVGGGSRR